MKCADCKTPRSETTRWARGLCLACYCRHWKTGTLNNFERTQHRRDDVIEDWLFLKHQGYTRRNAAERMGIKPKALEQAISRARRDGHPQLLESEAA